MGDTSVKMAAVGTYVKPRFSIVIPCYNEEGYLGLTLCSLKQQDFTGAYEIIVVDNNCTDNTTAIAAEYQARVIVENRPGVCWARQAGTEAARGEIVISTDADTVFDSDWLSRIDEHFLSDERLVAVCAPCDFIDSPWWGKVYPTFLFGSVYLFYRLSGRPFYITATNTAFKKSAWDGYDTEQTQGGDELALLHKLRRHGRVAFTLKYAVHTSSRRFSHGLWYNLFVTFLFYYMAAYYINKLFKRRVIGSAPAYRKKTILRQLPQLTVLSEGLTKQRKQVTVLSTKTSLLAREVVGNIVGKSL